MTLPNKISLLGRDVDVILEDIKELCGEASHTSNSMKINPHSPSNTQVETFYHEIIHLILGYTGAAQTISSKEEEAVCQSVGFALADFISKHHEDLPRYDKK